MSDQLYLEGKAIYKNLIRASSECRKLNLRVKYIHVRPYHTAPLWTFMSCNFLIDRQIGISEFENNLQGGRMTFMGIRMKLK